MTEKKLKRLVSAGTAIAVVFLFVLITVLIYQLVAMGTKKREAERLQREITELQEEIANRKDETDLWLKKWKIEERARQKGYIYKNDDNG